MYWYVCSAIIHIGVGFMGLHPCLVPPQRAFYFPKAYPLGFHCTFATILMNRTFKGFEWSMPIDEIKISTNVL